MGIEGVAPVAGRVRGFFAPVDRAGGQGAVWDAGAAFDVEAPAAPWVDLGWIAGFARKCGTKVEGLVSGAPGFAAGQVRTEVEATLSLEFESWGKLQMALAGGAQQMNVLGVQTAVGAGSSATSLDVGVGAASGFAVGDAVAVDVDYAGQTGYVGSGASGGYVRSAGAVGSGADYVRRVTLNVGRVAGIAGGVLTLSAPLLAGVPKAGMSASRVLGFCDREGASFFAEWSGLFVVDGAQGDRVVFFYPRLQAMSGAAEKNEALAAGLERMRLQGSFRALRVKDPVDGESVVCFRQYMTAGMRRV